MVRGASLFRSTAVDAPAIGGRDEWAKAHFLLLLSGFVAGWQVVDGVSGSKAHTVEVIRASTGFSAAVLAGGEYRPLRTTSFKVSTGK